MRKRPRYQHLPLNQLLAAYFFAGWHVRRMPRGNQEHRLGQAVWCRDYCNVFAGRWFRLGAGAWFIQVSPFGPLLSPGGIPLLAMLFLLAFSIGARHVAWQIVAQKHAGPPPIEEPVDFSPPKPGQLEAEDRARREAAGKDDGAPR
jgi:hypothetical protein